VALKPNNKNYKSADGTIQGFIVKPIDFNPAKNTLLFYGFMAVQQVNMTFLLIAAQHVVLL
jgi:hypothetical protein